MAFELALALGIQMGIFITRVDDESDLRVWMLKDRHKLDWVLKHQLNLDQFRLVCILEDDIFAPGYLALGNLTFYDEVIYMMR